MLVQKLRLQHGWSQEELAELSGVSVRTIQRLERGQSGSLESLKALAAVFDIDFNRLKEPLMANTDTPQGAPLAAGPAPVRPDEALALAHVRKVKGFWAHFFWFVVVIAGLAALNAYTGRHYWWFLWAAMGWGIGIVSHALSVFQPLPFFDAAWEKRQVEKYLQRKL